MQQFFNEMIGMFREFWNFFESIYEAIRNALLIVDSSLSFVFNTLGYLPSIIGTAVVLAVSIYLIRFLLLKQEGNMEGFFALIISFFKTIFNLLDSVRFTFGGVSVSFLGITFAFIFFFMVINLYWKGAKG